MNHAIAEKTNNRMNCDTFAGFWCENYPLCIVAELFHGFAYDDPAIWVFPWKEAKPIAEHLGTRLSAGNDRTAFTERDCAGEPGNSWRVCSPPGLTSSGWSTGVGSAQLTCTQVRCVSHC
jgi:hypothetical protein